MPLINGQKFSCEPCIRGHRATTCAHTDRILIEVRKPGRPLESCGHAFATCQCGKVAETLASMDNFFPDLLDNESPTETTSISTKVTTFPTLTASTPKHKPRTRSDSRAKKRSKKKAESSSTSSENNRGLGEPSEVSITGHDNSHASSSLTQHTWPPTQEGFQYELQPQQLWSEQQSQHPQSLTALPYQYQHSSHAALMQVSYPPQWKQSSSMGYASSIENGKFGTEPYSRDIGEEEQASSSEYAVAMGNGAWRSTD